MANALSSIASTPVVGLGTFTYTIPTTSLWTFEFKSFIPYLPAGTPPQSSAMSNNVQNITAVADSGGSLNSTYFTFYSASNLYGFYVWYNINSAGVDPAVAGLTGIQVTGATNASAATLATATIAAINANATAVTAGIVASAGASTHFIITNNLYGACTAAADGTAATGFNFAASSPAGSFGTPAASGLTVTLKDGSTILARWGNPSATQPMLSGAWTWGATAADSVSIVLASLSTADAGLIQPKSILNLYQGPAA